MNKTELEERIAALEKQRDQVVQQANLQIAGINGAIAECKWQLEQLDKAADQEEPTPQ